MRRPIVAVVGRPNVGKSTFFNKICGKRISIVDDTPGVTRDRLYADANWCGHDFLLVDTGGLDPKSEDVFQADIKKQAEIAMQESDVIVFLVDGKSGITSTDERSHLFSKEGKNQLFWLSTNWTILRLKTHMSFIALDWATQCHFL